MLDKIKDLYLRESVRAITLYLGTLGLIIAKSCDTRDKLPEPFDFFDHAGNITGSAGVAYLMGMFISKHANGDNNSVNARNIRLRMALGGLVAGVIVNGIIETKWGMNMVNWVNTPDPVDFAYGVGASTLIAATVPTVKDPGAASIKDDAH